MAKAVGFGAQQDADGEKVLRKAQKKTAKRIGGTSPQTVGITADQKLMNEVNKYSKKKMVKC